MVPVIALAVVLVAVKTGIVAEDPEAARPIAVLLFVQVYVVVPDELLVKVSGPTDDPAQTT